MDNDTICISSNDSLKKSLINNGASCVFYVGHGFESGINTSGFHIRDVKSLENSHMYSFFIFCSMFGDLMMNQTCV